MGGPAAVVGQKRGLYLRLVTGGMGQLIRQDKTRQDKTRREKSYRIVGAMLFLPEPPSVHPEMRKEKGRKWCIITYIA